MSTPSYIEQEYMKALGYLKASKISSINKRLINKLIVAKVPIAAVESKTSNVNYGYLSDREKEKFIDSLIAEEGDSEIVDSEEELLDSEPTMSTLSNKTLNNNLSKMSNKLNIERKINYDDRFDFMNHHPSREVESDEVEKKLLGGKYKSVFNDPKHPYWNKTTRYDPRLEHPNYAAYYADKHEGKAYRKDFNNDGVDDIVIANKAGNVTHINGHSMQKTKRGVNLHYWDSADYAKEPHSYTNKAGQKVLQLTDKSAKKVWIDSLSNVDKRKFNEDLRKAGVTSFKVVDEKAENLLKNNAKIVYDSVKESIVNQFNVDKTDLSKQMTSATFASRIVNTILLAAGGLFGANVKLNADLTFYINKLRKAFNKTDENKQKILDYGNEMLLALEKSSHIPNFAKAIWNISSKEPTLESYKALYNVMIKAKTLKGNIGDVQPYYSTLRTKNLELAKRPAKKGEGKARPEPKKHREKPSKPRKPKSLLPLPEDYDY